MNFKLFRRALPALLLALLMLFGCCAGAAAVPANAVAAAPVSAGESAPDTSAEEPDAAIDTDTGSEEAGPVLTGAETFTEGVTVGDISLAGKTLAEAEAAVREHFTALQKGSLTLSIVDGGAKSEEGTAPVARTPETTAAETTAAETTAAETVAGETAADGETAPAEGQPAGPEALFTVDVPLADLELTMPGETEVEELLKSALFAGNFGTLLSRYKARRDIKTEGLKLELSTAASEDAVRTYVEEVLAVDYIAGPRNAKCTVKGGKLVVTEKDSPGVEVDVESTTALMLEALQSGFEASEALTVPVYTAEAELTAEMVEKMQSSLGYGETWFQYTGEDANRGSNVMVATRNMNGVIIMPDQTVSCDKMFKPRTTANGYKEAHAFSNGQVIDSLGGGICQVATTLYQCVLQAELKVVERHNHSMTVSYVPASMDATIDAGNKDLRFTNNTGNPIYIEAYTTKVTSSSAKVCFRFWGVENHSSSHKVSYTSVEVERNPTYNYVLDGSQAPSPNIQYNGDTHDEVSSYLIKKVTENGKTTSTRMNEDYYRPQIRTVYINTLGTGIHLVDGKPVDENGNVLKLNSTSGLPTVVNVGTESAPLYSYALAGGGHASVSGEHSGESSSETTPAETQPTQSTEESTAETQPSSEAETQPSSAPETQPSTEASTEASSSGD